VLKYLTTGTTLPIFLPFIVGFSATNRCYIDHENVTGIPYQRGHSPVSGSVDINLCLELNCGGHHVTTVVIMIAGDNKLV
jgi:hypothetical protein